MNNNQFAKKESKHLFSWAVSILVILLGLLVLLSYFPSGAMMIGGGLLVNPRMRSRLYLKRWISYVLCLLLVAFGSALLPDANAGTDADQSAGIVDAQEAEQTPEELEAAFKETCQEYAYKTLMRTPDEYEGEHIVLQLKISQVLGDGDYVGYTQSESGWYGDRYYLLDQRKGGFKILEDDIITVYGTFEGVKTAKTVLGAKEEVPVVSMVYATLDEE